MSKLNKQEILKLAEQLEDPENPILVACDTDEELFDKVASSFIKAAEALREVADCVEALEPSPAPFTVEKLDEMAAIAEEFEKSDDELLQKQAAVLDDILETLASPKNALMFSLAADGDRITELKKKYKDIEEKQKEWMKASEAVKDIEKSEVYKEYRTNEAPLSTRTCPSHPGAALQRIGENTVRCSLGGEEISWEEGYTTQKGNKVPGGSVSNQTSFDQGANEFTTMDSRALRMQFAHNE